MLVSLTFLMSHDIWSPLMQFVWLRAVYWESLGGAAYSKRRYWGSPVVLLVLVVIPRDEARSFETT